MESLSWLPVVFRGSERLLIILFAGMCIYLGYRLFERALEAQTDFEAGHGESRMLLRKVAPGTLFALFGALVLGLSVWRVLLMTPSQTIMTPGIQFGARPIPSDVEKQRSVEALAALNTVLRHSDTGIPINQDEKIEIANAYNVLRNHRKRLINDILGSDAFEKYEKWADSLRSDPTFLSKLSAEDQKLFETVNGWSEQ